MQRHPRSPFSRSRSSTKGSSIPGASDGLERQALATWPAMLRATLRSTRELLRRHQPATSGWRPLSLAYLSLTPMRESPRVSIHRHLALTLRLAEGSTPSADSRPGTVAATIIERWMGRVPEAQRVRAVIERTLSRLEHLRALPRPILPRSIILVGRERPARGESELVPTGRTVTPRLQGLPLPRLVHAPRAESEVPRPRVDGARLGPRITRLETELVRMRPAPLHARTELIHARLQPVLMRLELLRTRHESLRTRTELVRARTDLLRMAAEPPGAAPRSSGSRSERMAPLPTRSLLQARIPGLPPLSRVDRGPVTPREVPAPAPRLTLLTQAMPSSPSGENSTTARPKLRLGPSTPLEHRREDAAPSPERSATLPARPTPGRPPAPPVSPTLRAPAAPPLDTRAETAGADAVHSDAVREAFDVDQMSRTEVRKLADRIQMELNRRTGLRDARKAHQ